MKIGILLFMAGTGLCGAAGEAPWDSFRGHGHDGVTTLPLNVPKVWPKKLTVLWSADAGGGYSSPIFDGSAIYFQDRTDSEEFVSAFDANTGKHLWKRKVADLKDPGTSQPASTPSVEAGALYVEASTGVLFKLDAKDGSVFWKRDIPAEWPGEKPEKFGPSYGVSSSPLLLDGAVILPTGTKDTGKIMGFAMADGSPLWSVDTAPPSYASCIPLKIDGGEYLCTLLFNGVIALKKEGTRYVKFAEMDLPGGPDGNVATPLALGGNGLICVTSQDATLLFKLDVKEKKFLPQWRLDAGGYLSAPISAADTIYLHDSRSLLRIAGGDGRKLRALEMDAQYCALLSWDRFIFCRLHEGTLKIVDTGGEVLKIAAEFPGEDEGTDSWSSVIPVGDSRIVMRSGSKLRCLSWMPKGP